MLKKLKGFTLIELLIVIAIIAILTVAFLPTLRGGQVKARDAARKAAVNEIVVAIEKIINGDVPGSAVGIPLSAAGACLDFSAALATVGGDIRTALAKVPVAQPTNVKLCDGGYFYRSYPAVAPLANYVVAVQLEEITSGNFNAAINFGANAVAALTAVNTQLGNIFAEIPQKTIGASSAALWLVTK